jgi:Subtilase family
MTIEWVKIEDNLRDGVLNPAASFRVNVVSRIIAEDLQVDEDALWWLILIDPAIIPPGEPGAGSRNTIADIFELAKELDIGDDPSAFLSIPPEYSSAFRETPPPGPVSLYARRLYINAVNIRATNAGIAWLEVGPSFREQDLVLQEFPFLPEPDKTVVVPQGTVVMAVIDNGMAVGHELFRSADDTGTPVSRVEFFWNMDGSGVDTTALPLDSTQETPVGNGWTKVGLTARLQQNMHSGLLDDPAFYASIGATDWATRSHTPVAQRRSHGTHVMGLCAGYPTNDAVDTEEVSKRPIIAVNLRTQDVEDPSGNQVFYWLEPALHYIIERYKRYEIEGAPGTRPPLVINFSFGNFAGPHDGTGLIESVIKAKLQEARSLNPNCQFVLPAGNGNQNRCHARVALTGDEPAKTLNWQVQPADASISAVQIWLDNEGFGQNVDLTVQGPGGLDPVTLDTSADLDLGVLVDDAGTLIGVAYYLSSFITPFKRSVFGVILFATASPFDVKPFAPSGRWELTLGTDAGGEDVGMHAWIERDETLPGFSEFGRQSYFDDPKYARFYEPGIAAYGLDKRLIGGLLGYDPIGSTALVQRKGSLNGFAGGDDTVVVAAFVRTSLTKDSPMALYSSTGLTRNGVDIFADASAISESSKVARGVVSAGSASGSFVALNGTSVSAPQVARWIANQLATGQSGGPAAVSAAADNQDPSGINNPRKPPPIRAGSGRMLGMQNLFGQPR